MIYKTGQNPGIGTYICNVCGHIVMIYDNLKVLPPCPRCDCAGYLKYKDIAIKNVEYILF